MWGPGRGARGERDGGGEFAWSLPGAGGRQKAGKDPVRLLAARPKEMMKISARTALCAAALAAVAASAAAQDNIIENLANSAADSFTNFFSSLNDMLTNSLTSFA